MAIATIILYGVGGFVLFLILGIGGFVWFMKKKGGKKFPFLLYSLDGARMQTIFAQVKADPNNKTRKRFNFANTETTLEIQPPTVFVDGKGYREIVWNDLGELSYLSKTRLNWDKYRELAVTPEEKALALHRYKENETRYENAANKMEMAMLIGGFILILLLGIGIIYSTITYANVVKDHVKIAESNNANVKIMKESINTMGDVVERIAGITAALTGDEELIRQIT